MKKRKRMEEGKDEGEIDEWTPLDIFDMKARAITKVDIDMSDYRTVYVQFY